MVFELEDNDYAAINAAVEILRLALGQVDMTGLQVVGAGRALHALERLPASTLCDRIVEGESAVPVPEWHREVLRQRLEDRQLKPEDGLDWNVVRERLRQDLARRGDDR